tara:strand:+ start:1259 stop:1843 length:585 start_codon:yes stop_codon:yes gene_type:complete
MSEFQTEIGGLATGFAEVSSRATASSNLRRLEIAEGNVRATTDQIRLEETTQRQNISRELAKFQGSQAAARAYRGGGGLGTGFAVDSAAASHAADQAAIVEANAANKEIATIAANQVMMDDPVLAAIQGGVEGMNMGMGIANALMSEARTRQVQGSMRVSSGGAGAPPTYQNYISTILDIPGFNINDFLGGLNF